MTFTSLINTNFATSIEAYDRPLLIVYQQFKASYLHLDVAKAIVAVAEFTRSFTSDQSQTVTPFRHHSKENLEQFYDLTYRLLSIPEPLRDFEDVISPFASIELSLHNQDTPMSKVKTTAAPDIVTKAIEIALRILALMFLKSQMLDIPCGETLLLELLQQQVATILSERQVNHNEELFINQAAHHESERLQRSTLIWICLAGDHFSNAKLYNEDSEASRQPTSYIELLRCVVTTKQVADASLVSDDDLLLSRCLDLRYLKGELWDERHAIRNMLGKIQS